MGMGISCRFCLVVLFLMFFSGLSLAAQTEVLWLGHSTVRLISPEGKVIVTDPFLTKNPKTPSEYRDLKALGKVDLILVTHGHRDHIHDLKELANLTGAKVVAPYGFALNMTTLGVIDTEMIIGMNKGGTVSPIGRNIKVHMVPAEHGSNVDFTMPGLTLEANMPRAVEAGPAVGYVIEFENGFTVYHSGDTAVFSDMALIREFYKPDLALVCIGGFFTMDPAGAAYAIKNLLKPKYAVPIHYGTFPVINRTPDELVDAMGNSSIKILTPDPGEAIKF